MVRSRVGTACRLQRPLPPDHPSLQPTTRPAAKRVLHRFRPEHPGDKDNSPHRAESVQVAGERFRHLDTLGPDERNGDVPIAVGEGHEPRRPRSRHRSPNRLCVGRCGVLHAEVLALQSARGALALGRKHEQRTTRRGRDPDARFSAKRSRARDSAAVGTPAGGVRRVLPRDSASRTFQRARSGDNGHA